MLGAFSVIVKALDRLQLWLLQFVIQNSGSEAAAAAAGGVFIAAKLKITSKSELNKLLENLDKYATLNPKV